MEPKENQMNFRRKSNRLDSSLYKGTNCYFVTICTNEKNDYFTEARLVDRLIEWLRGEAMKDYFAILAYCFMPDHLHLLLRADGTTSLIDFIRKYKQITAYQFKREYGKILWQKSFYDHILRKEEDTKDVILYMFNNPVRKKIVDDFAEYPFLGSFEFDLKEL